MKRLLIFLMIIFNFQAQALSIHPMMSVKERLRLSLWVEGLKEPQSSQPQVQKIILPEELERALKKI
jgi:hypothetical protein